LVTTKDYFIIWIGILKEFSILELGTLGKQNNTHIIVEITTVFLEANPNSYEMIQK
jgi:hypothetical protein